MNKYIVAALSRLRVLHYCNCELFCAVVLTHIFAFNQMDRVISTIKSLECVNVLQVNVKEDKEVVVPCFGHGSGSGSGYVNNMKKLMKWMPQMLKIQLKIIAQKVTRKIMNLSSSDNFSERSERKRKSNSLSKIMQ